MPYREDGFMTLETTPAGALYMVGCRKCGATLVTHEWTHDDHNERRDAMENGTLRCDDCGGRADAETFSAALDPQYAARYSASGYMDCTDWSYGADRLALEEEVNEMYGDWEEDDETA